MERPSEPGLCHTGNERAATIQHRTTSAGRLRCTPCELCCTRNKSETFIKLYWWRISQSPGGGFNPSFACFSSTSMVDEYSAKTSSNQGWVSPVMLPFI